MRIKPAWTKAVLSGDKDIEGEAVDIFERAVRNGLTKGKLGE